MSYQITPEQTAEITDLDVTFGTVKFLPPWEEIPDEFKHTKVGYTSNLFVEIAEALFSGKSLPPGDVKPRPEFPIPGIQRVVAAHLKSFEPKHQHKIAGVAYMISLMVE